MLGLTDDRRDHVVSGDPRPEVSADFRKLIPEMPRAAASTFALEGFPEGPYTKP